MAPHRFRFVCAVGACALLAAAGCDDAFVASSGGGSGTEAATTGTGGAATTTSSTIATSTTSATGGGGAVGGSGNGGSGNGGSAVGGGGALNDAGLLVRYFLDEKATGAPTGPIVDAAPNPIGLQVSGAGNLTYTVEDGSRGLNWSWPAGETTDPVRAFTYPGPSKIIMSVQEQATIEVVARIQNTSPNGSRLINWGNNGADSDFSVAVSPTEFLFRSNSDSVVISWGLAPDGLLHVYHIVIDRTLTSVASAHQLYVDGVSVGGILKAGDAMAALGPMVFNPAAEFTLGNRSDNQRSIHGVIGYLAIYDRAMPTADVMDQVQALQLSHDSAAPP